MSDNINSRIMEGGLMCKVNCQVAEGLSPTEKVVRFTCVEGREEEVAVPSSVVHAKSFQAQEVGRLEDRVLIELPRESMSGRWRVWVPVAQVSG